MFLFSLFRKEGKKTLQTFLDDLTVVFAGKLSPVILLHCPHAVVCFHHLPEKHQPSCRWKKLSEFSVLLNVMMVLMVGRRVLSVFTSGPSPLFPSVSFPAPQPAEPSSEEPPGFSEQESVLSAVEGQSSAEAAFGGGEPSPSEPPPSSPRTRNTNQTAKLFTPSKLNFSVRTFQWRWSLFQMFWSRRFYGAVLCDTRCLDQSHQQLEVTATTPQNLYVP